MAVAAQINIEFRRIEKFSAIVAGSGIYVTDSWILKTSAYRVHVAQHTDSHLSIAGKNTNNFTLQLMNSVNEFENINKYSKVNLKQSIF